MWRRFLVSFVIICASLILLGAFPDEAAAQDRGPVYTTSIGKPAGLRDLATRIKHSSQPVRINWLHGPDSLVVGEDGRFSASTNIEVASLPVCVQWDFGDGTTAKGLHALHRYSEPGTYTVSLKLFNAHSEATDSLMVSVKTKADSVTSLGTPVQ